MKDKIANNKVEKGLVKRLLVMTRIQPGLICQRSSLLDMNFLLYPMHCVTFDNEGKKRINAPTKLCV